MISSNVQKVLGSYSDSLQIKHVENISGEDSVLAYTTTSPYFGSPKELLLFNVKTSGKNHYIKIASSNIPLVTSLGFSYSQIASQQNHIRIPLDEIENANTENLRALYLRLLESSLSSYAFGCCHLYNDCSDAGKCLHDNPLYAMVCQYKKNLESNHIFYGINRNID